MRHLVLAFWTLLWFSATLRADDWPQWLGPQRDSIWRETGILTSFAEGGLTVRWRAPIAAGFSGPAVAKGRVFVTDRVVPDPVKNKKAGSERVLCLDAGDGKILWKHEYDCEYGIGYPLGPRVTPNIVGGKVYALGAEGSLF